MRKRDFSLRKPTASQERSGKKKSACCEMTVRDGRSARRGGLLDAVVGDFDDGGEQKERRKTHGNLLLFYTTEMVIRLQISARGKEGTNARGEVVTDAAEGGNFFFV